MQSHNLEQSDRNESKKRDSRTAAVSALIGGSALMAAATFGVLSIEAEHPSDALGSINVADRTYFVTSEEMPIIAMGLTGLTAVGLGVDALRRKEEE